MFVLLVNKSKSEFSELAATFQEQNIQTDHVESGDKALSMILRKNYALVIAGESLTDMTGLEFSKKLLTVNPMINCDMASSLSPEDFHNESEGLGLLMHLSLNPNKEEAKNLIKHLEKIIDLTKQYR